jgi:Zn-dependent protease
VIFAITLHEAAHGYVAKMFGDNTAYVLGRVSLNPTRHIDPLGTIIFPLLTMFLGGMLFGWAKPVPVNQGQLREPRRHMIWVVLAGPASNFVMAFMWAILLRILLSMGQTDGFLWQVSMAGIQINLILMVLNLLPIPPLDGGRVIMNLVPLEVERMLARIEPYGIWILLLLLMTGTLQPVIGSGVQFFYNLILQIVLFGH